MIEKLEQLGLSKTEAKIYLALLESGPQTATALAKKLSIHRTSIYDYVAMLLSKGFVSKLVDKKIDTFLAEPIEKLPVIMELKVKEQQEKVSLAQQMIGELKFVVSKQPGKPKVSIYENIEGIKALYEDTLLSGEEIKSFSSTDSLESFDREFLHKYYARRAEKGIPIKAIINDVPSAHEYKKEDPGLKREIRIVPEDTMDIQPEVYVYDNKVAIFSLEEKYGVLIESYDIATAIKKLYDLAWKEAGRK